MSHEILLSVSRNERRMLLENERRRRKSGNWGEWEHIMFARGSAGQGWAADFTDAFRNQVFSVLWRVLPDGVEHFAISSLTQERPTWPEMQRIKDELAGHDRTGVEVYPPHAEIVDQANMYHLWVLPSPLSFSLARKPEPTP